MSDMQRSAAEAWGRPRCGQCGHDLSGATDSSKCPECGRPLVEVLVRETAKNLRFRRYASKATLFGMPAIAVATGIGPDGQQGHARGWIAIGDKATGVIALGGLARGVFALGGLSIGLFTCGGMSLGVFLSFGGMSIAPLGMAVGGMAVGALAAGGMAVGYGAIGGGGFGYHTWAPGGSGIHRMIVRGGSPDPAAVAFFERLSWLLGPPTGRVGLLRPLAWIASLMIAVLLLLGTPAILRWSREGDERKEAY
jgi:hypothetical protein